MTFSFFIARLLLSSGRLLLYGFDPFVVAFDSERDVAGGRPLLQLDDVELLHDRLLSGSLRLGLP
jgi:hypothetical protein